MYDPLTFAIITFTFLVAGSVKGVIGLGLPSVSLALLAVVFDLPTAMALLLVPSFVTNLWQGLIGGNTLTVVQRLWPFLLSATFAVWMGSLVLIEVNSYFLTGLLGVLLMAYSAFSLFGVKLSIQKQSEIWSGPLFGIANGVLTGMTGSFVVPGVLYLQALGLDRNMLIQAMGMLFTLSTIALAVSLQGGHLLNWELVQMSSAGLVPALIGMVIGQKVRHRLSENQFRRVFFASLLILGAYILINATWNLLAI